jgi:AcrR family transcriptional regulator
MTRFLIEQGKMASRRHLRRLHYQQLNPVVGLMARTADPGRSEAILSAAEAIIKEGRFEEMRMAEVASRAGMAVGTLYLYFPSKHDILRALAARLFDRAASFLIPIFDRPVERATLVEAVDGMFELMESERETLSLGSKLAPDAATPLAPEARKRLVHHLADRLARHMDAGTVRRYPDSVALADYVVMLIRRAVIAVASQEDGGRERYEATLVELLQSALLAPARVAEDAVS